MYKFKVILTNIPHASDRHFETYEQAKAYMRSCGFECSMWDMNMDRLYATYSPINGYNERGV